MIDKLSLLKQTLVNKLAEEIKRNKLREFKLSTDHFDGILLSAFAANQANVSVLSKKFIKGVLALQIVYQNLLTRDQVLDNYNLVNLKKEEIHKLIDKDKLFNHAYTLAREVKNTSFLESFSKTILKTTEGRLLQERYIGKKLSFVQYKKINELKQGNLFELFFSFPFILKQKQNNDELIEIKNFGNKLGLFHQYMEDFLDYSLFNNLKKPPFQNYKNQKWSLPCFFVPLFTWGKDLKSFLIYFLEHPLSILEESYKSFLKQQVNWLSKKSKLIFSEDNHLLFDLLFQEWLVRIKKVIYFEKKYKLMFFDLKKYFLEISNENDKVNQNIQNASFLLTEEFVSTKGQLKNHWATLFNKKNFVQYNTFSFVRPLLSKKKQTSFFAIMLFAHLLNDIKNRYKKESKKAAIFFLIWKILLKQTYTHNLPLFPFLYHLTDETKKTSIPFQYLLLLVDTKKKEMNYDFYPAYYPKKKDLYHYTLNFSGVIGLWLYRQWFPDTPIQKIATNNQIILSLARAIQLTEILRKMREDIENNQIYIPLELLKQNDITITDLVNHTKRKKAKIFSRKKHPSANAITGSYKKMLSQLINEIQNDYEYSLKKIKDLAPSIQKPVIIIGFLYKNILDKIVAKEYDNLSNTIEATWLDKVKQTLKGLNYLQKTKREKK